ncbi:Hypothetical predicted protein [Cloeon dipterum]|uniref:Uncharacterized protein n=1 Tax=Cloeon dipterum TaxID=197152 RepID=A0A8S1DRY4_9INSE|nr:Hypothetical predicted protein [Cloeon dipterum]
MSDNSGKKEQPSPKHGQPSDESNAENDDGKPKSPVIDNTKGVIRYYSSKKPESSHSVNPSPSLSISRDSVHGASDDLSLSSLLATSPRPEIGNQTTRSDNTLASGRKPESFTPFTSENRELSSQSSQRGTFTP